MNKLQKTLIYLVIALVVINIGMLVFIWTSKGGPFRPNRERPQRARMERFFEQKLQLSQEQQKLFRESQKTHQRQMDILHREVRLLNRTFHQAIIAEDSAEELTISNKLDSLTMLIKEESASHIRELADACTPEQRENLLQALDQLPDRRGNRPPRR